MELITNIILNLQAPDYAVAYAPQTDSIARKIRAQLVNGSTPWPVPDGASMIIRYMKPDGTWGFYDSIDGTTAYTVSGSSVTFELAAQMLTAVGVVLVQLNFYNANNEKLSSFTWRLIVPESAVVSDAEIVSSNYFEVLTGTLSEMQTLMEQTEEYAQDAASFVGSPLVASTVAEMTDQDKIYVYVGSETGYPANHWYYWNGTAWTDGGVYQSAAVALDSTLTEAGKAAQAKATGDAIDELNSALDDSNLSAFAVPAVYGDLVDSANWTLNVRIGPTNGSNGSADGYARCDYVSFEAATLFRMEDSDFTICVWAYRLAGTSSALYGPYHNYDHSEILLPCKDSAKKFRISVRKVDGTTMTSEDLTSALEGIKTYTLTDQSLSVPYAPADAKATGDAINDIASVILHDSTITSDALPDFGYSINTQNKWAELTSSSKSKASVIAIPKSVKKAIFTTNANGSVFAFLNSNTAAAGETPDYSTGYNGRIVTSTVQTLSYDISGDMNYLYVLKINSSEASTLPTITFEYYTDATLSEGGIAADAKATGDIISKTNAVVDDISLSNEMILYTDFEALPGTYNAVGELAHVEDEGYIHSAPLRINPNERYYFGWQNLTVTGAFFDINKNWIAPLLTADLTAATYKFPNGKPEADTSHYVEFYYFTSPVNAYYISINLSTSESRGYRNYVSNKPVFALSGTGNYYVSKNDPIYQKYKNRKLCIIGPSTVSIDRAYHTGNNTGDGTDTTQYLVGFQEYLVPWWHTVDSYGYSSASWRKYDIVDGAESDSIYTYVVTNQIDISGYDDYLLLTSSNGGLEVDPIDTIGTITSAVDLGDVTTYMGGLRQTIDYIYSLNPGATIYCQTIRYQGSTFGTSESRRQKIMHVNDEIRNMCRLCSFHLVDSAYDSGFNQYNSDMYSYDNGSHYNQIGSQVMGLSFRKAILGF